MKRAGFTLIEVMVALVIGTAVVLMVHQTFASLIDISARLEEARAKQARDYRARDLLAATFGSLDVRSSEFAGGTDRIRFGTVAGGNAESAELFARAGSLLLVRPGRTDTVMPAASMRADYLLSDGAQSRWLMQWHSPSSAPVLIRLRLARDTLRTDTLLLAVGSRG